MYMESVETLVKTLDLAVNSDWSIFALKINTKS